MEKVRLGVIGLGGMGQGHLRSIKEVQEAELTAVSVSYTHLTLPTICSV